MEKLIRFRMFLGSHPVILTEGAIIERLRRQTSFELDSNIANAGFIYDPDKKPVLENLYRQYIDIGQKYDLPIIILTPTWRANPERVQRARLNFNINKDAFSFLNEIRKSYGRYAKQIMIGGLIGCKNDAYKAEEALRENEAAAFHSKQIKVLAGAGVDFLIASTLPALSEAIGIAKAMSRTNMPYMLSFVVTRDSNLLDEISLANAISKIDTVVKIRPVGYMLNCVHPLILRSAVKRMDMVRHRILGLQANTSSRSPKELDRAAELDSGDPEKFGELMSALHLDYGLKILGGCCGTDHRHIQAIAQRVK